ncbi:hypothetical protein GCM10023153_10330 [Ornithinibacter aureus]|uniref:Squalene cyclase C-terminal domain-containing protein n=2 Tax=Ornithinibacter aureus TaxID=622664 RepID=A0ABP8JJU3_9MICO|nr:squalene-hopene cyclase-like protein [Ornithinibacter aureus]
MTFLREVGQIAEFNQNELVNSLLRARHAQAGWHVLAVSNAPSVEGTAPALMALRYCDHSGSLQAVLEAESWLAAQQHQSGGWGSDKTNQPRTYTTALALRALAGSTNVSAETVAKGALWLKQSKRQDGSWGETPDKDGGLAHTAMAVRALFVVEGPNSHSAQEGVKYIEENWRPGREGIRHESYDFHIGDPYHRITNIFDTEAEIVLALTEGGTLRLPHKVLSVASRWESEASQSWWTRSDNGNSMSCLWTLVPRAQAAARIERWIGTGRKATWSQRAIATYTGSITSLWLLALSSLRPGRQWKRRLIQVACFGWILTFILLWRQGSIDLPQTVLSVILPILLLAIQIDSSPERGD